MRTIRFGLSVMLVVFIGAISVTPAQASIITFTGGDTGVAAGGARPNSDAAAALFDAAVGSFTLITFESLAVGNFAALGVAPGVTATLTNAENAFCNGICGTNDTDLGYNTTGGGSKYVRVVPPFNSAAGATLTFSFTTPIDAFGAYFTGTESGFPGLVNVNFNDGSSQAFNLPENGAGGGVLFWGFTDFGASILSVSVNGGATAGSRDIFGVDDVRFRAAAVPEPGTLTLFASGVAAFLVARRRRLVRR